MRRGDPRLARHLDPREAAAGAPPLPRPPAARSPTAGSPQTPRPPVARGAAPTARRLGDAARRRARSGRGRSRRQRCRAVQRTAEGGKLWADIRKGDTLVAAKLDRMFRSASDCLAVVEAFKARGASLFLLDLNGGADDVSGNGIARLFLTIRPSRNSSATASANGSGRPSGRRRRAANTWAGRRRSVTRTMPSGGWCRCPSSRRRYGGSRSSRPRA